ncbi:MAG: PEGA domain-containing protein [Myxococcales bacterium]
MNDTLSRAVLAAALVFGAAGTALASEIKLTTEPSGANVQLDDVAFGQSPVTIKKVTRGSHTLKVSLEGYVTREDVIDVDGESDFQIHAPLNPAPKPPPAEPARPTPPPAEPKRATAPPPAPPPPSPAPPPPPPLVEARTVPDPPAKKSLMLLVETVPDNAFVQVVGLDENKRSPATFTGFAPGTLQLLVRAPGFKDKKVEVNLQHDARTRVKLDPL